MLDDYQLGLLYGGGSFVSNEFRFYASSEYMFDYIENMLNHILADFETELIKKENFRAKIIIKDKEVIDYLKNKGIFNKTLGVNRDLNADFIRGFLETNGSFYSYLDKGVKLWRCTFSGQLEDLELIKCHLESLNIGCRNIETRKTKKPSGTVSITYRLPIGARKSIQRLVEYLKTDEEGKITSSLSQKFDEFLEFNQENPRRSTPVNEYTRARYAVEAMCRTLKFDFQKSESKRPYQILIGVKNDEWEFEGYKEAYEFISIIYEKEIGNEAPNYKSK